MIPAPGIYMIQHRTSKRTYVGSSRNVSDRCRNHFSRLRAGRHDNPALQADWNVAGSDGFIALLLESVENDGQSLNAAERRWCELLLAKGIELYCRQIAGRPRGQPSLPGLKHQRLLAALTQDQLAQMAAVSRASVTRLESGGQANPTMVRRLADALKCEPRDLIKPE